MATSEKLLSTKGQDKMEEIDANSEDGSVKDVGGPEPEWTTAQYANFSFDATAGVKTDTSIPKKVKAEPGEALKEEEGEDAKVSDDEKADKEKDKEDLKEEDDEESKDEESDDDDIKITVEAEEGDDEKDAEEELADEFSLDLKDLTDGNEEFIDLVKGDGDGVDDEEPVEEAEEPIIEPDMEESASEDEEMLPLPESDDEESDEDEFVFDDEKAEKEKVDEADELPTELPIEEADDEESEDKTEDDEEEIVEAEDEEAFLDKQDEECEPKTKDDGKLKEGKIRLNFKLPQTAKLFEGHALLSEDDKRQTRVLFEAAIRTSAKKIAAQLQETYQSRYARVKKLHEKRMAKKVDAYLTYVVEQWVRENRKALRSQINHRLSESFLKGMKNLFLEHWVEVPESKINVVEALAKNVKSLKKQIRLNEAAAVQRTKELRTAVARERLSLMREHKARLIAEAAAAVVGADRGDFAKKAGLVRFTDTKSFKKDLVALRESYSRAKKSAERPINMPTATPLFEEKPTKKIATAVDAYAAAVDKLTQGGR